MRKIRERRKEMKENEEGLMVSSFDEMIVNGSSNRKIYTTLEDAKKLFNLETSCDYRINDCKGEKIRVKDVVIKINEKEMKEPVVDEETGEVIKDKEITMVTILIDEEGRSYVTGSKIFTMQMINYIKMFGLESIKEGLEIKITDKAIKNSNNRGLAFELV